MLLAEGVTEVFKESDKDISDLSINTTTMFWINLR